MINCTIFFVFWLWTRSAYIFADVFVDKTRRRGFLKVMHEFLTTTPQQPRGGTYNNNVPKYRAADCCSTIAPPLPTGCLHVRAWPTRLFCDTIIAIIKSLSRQMTCLWLKDRRDSLFSFSLSLYLLPSLFPSDAAANDGYCPWWANEGRIIEWTAQRVACISTATVTAIFG